MKWLNYAVEVARWNNLSLQDLTITGAIRHLPGRRTKAFVKHEILINRQNGGTTSELIFRGATKLGRERSAKQGVNMMWTRAEREIINELHYSNNISFIIRTTISLWSPARWRGALCLCFRNSLQFSPNINRSGIPFFIHSRLFSAASGLLCALNK